jgi:Flagellar protein FliT
VDAVAAYARLVEMCEQERDLIAAGDWDAVVSLGKKRAALAAGLPSRPPAGARSHLRRAIDLSRENAAALAAARAATVAELGQLRTVRQTIRAYVGDAPAAFVDTRS